MLTWAHLAKYRVSQSSDEHPVESLAANRSLQLGFMRGASAAVVSILQRRTYSPSSKEGGPHHAPYRNRLGQSHGTRWFSYLLLKWCSGCTGGLTCWKSLSDIIKVLWKHFRRKETNLARDWSDEYLDATWYVRYQVSLYILFYSKSRKALIILLNECNH